MTIGWEKESYTIAEENSHLDVYVRLMGFLETILPQVPITVEAGSAIEGQGRAKAVLEVLDINFIHSQELFQFFF